MGNEGIREKIISESIELFMSYGLRSVTMDDIAKHLGISKKTIYQHFKDKEEIIFLATAMHFEKEHKSMALGRGIVREDTAAILLDEPLTVIDPKERWDLRRKLREVQKELKITMIYVTHDQHEALTFAEHVSVIKDGRLIQTGSPEELHAEPQTPFIGYFIGTPGMNLIDCVLTEKGLETRGLNIVISDALRSRFSGSGEKKIQFGIRPEFVQISKERKEGWLPFQVDVIEKMGVYMNLSLRYQDLEIKARAQEEIIVTENEQIWVNFPEDKSKVFQGGTRLF